MYITCFSQVIYILPEIYFTNLKKRVKYSYFTDLWHNIKKLLKLRNCLIDKKTKNVVNTIFDISGNLYL